jgi:hypothetical protein
MEEIIRSWILGLGGAAALGAIAVAVTPAGPVRSVTRMLCGVILALALVSPVLDLNMDAYSLGLAAYREQAGELTGAWAETEDRLNRTIIEEECAAYIWDKAQELGVQAGRVRITAKWGDGCWVPWEAQMEFSGTDDQKIALSAVLEAELGIPAKRQYWNEND